MIAESWGKGGWGVGFTLVLPVHAECYIKVAYTSIKFVYKVEKLGNYMHPKSRSDTNYLVT